MTNETPWLFWSNIGVIITVVLASVRLTWFLGRMDLRIENKADKSALQIVENKADRAHQRLDEMKKKATHAH